MSSIWAALRRLKLTILTLSLLLQSMNVDARPMQHQRRSTSLCESGIMLTDEFEKSCSAFEPLKTYLNIGGMFPTYISNDAISAFCSDANDCVSEWRDSDDTNVSDTDTPYTAALGMCEQDENIEAWRMSGSVDFIRGKQDLLDYSCMEDSEGLCYFPTQKLLSAIPKLANPNFYITPPRDLCRPCVQWILRDIVEKYNETLFLGLPDDKRETFIDVALNSCNGEDETESSAMTEVETMGAEMLYKRNHHHYKKKKLWLKPKKKHVQKKKLHYKKKKPYKRSSPHLINRQFDDDDDSSATSTTVAVVSSAPGLADWKVCTDSSLCASGCCSNEYSDEFKCTPYGSSSQCIFASESETSTATTTEILPTKLADWEICTDSAWCINGCCSNEFSDEYKCTPGGSKCIIVDETILEITTTSSLAKGTIVTSEETTTSGIQDSTIETSSSESMITSSIAEQPTATDTLSSILETETATGTGGAESSSVMVSTDSSESSGVVGSATEVTDTADATATAVVTDTNGGVTDTDVVTGTMDASTGTSSYIAATADATGDVTGTNSTSTDTADITGTATEATEVTGTGDVTATMDASTGTAGITGTPTDAADITGSSTDATDATGTSSDSAATADVTGDVSGTSEGTETTQTTGTAEVTETAETSASGISEATDTAVTTETTKTVVTTGSLTTATTTTQSGKPAASPKTSNAKKSDGAACKENNECSTGCCSQDSLKCTPNGKNCIPAAPKGNGNLKRRQFTQIEYPSSSESTITTGAPYESEIPATTIMTDLETSAAEFTSEVETSIDATDSAVDSTFSTDLTETVYTTTTGYVTETAPTEIAIVGKKADWAECTDSSECENQCCSKEFSTSLLCSPQSTECVSSNYDGWEKLKRRQLQNETTTTVDFTETATESTGFTYEVIIETESTTYEISSEINSEPTALATTGTSANATSVTTTMVPSITSSAASDSMEAEQSTTDSVQNPNTTTVPVDSVELTSSVDLPSASDGLALEQSTDLVPTTTSLTNETFQSLNATFPPPPSLTINLIEPTSSADESSDILTATSSVQTGSVDSLVVSAEETGTETMNTVNTLAITKTMETVETGETSSSADSDSESETATFQTTTGGLTTVMQTTTGGLTTVISPPASSILDSESGSETTATDSMQPTFLSDTTLPTGSDSETETSDEATIQTTGNVATGLLVLPSSASSAADVESETAAANDTMPTTTGMITTSATGLIVTSSSSSLVDSESDAESLIEATAQITDSLPSSVITNLATSLSSSSLPEESESEILSGAPAQTTATSTGITTDQVKATGSSSVLEESSKVEEITVAPTETTGIQTLTPAAATTTVTSSPSNKKPARKGDWISCTQNEECSNGCCSDESGTYKCTPNGKKCISKPPNPGLFRRSHNNRRQSGFELLLSGGCPIAMKIKDAFEDNCSGIKVLNKEDKVGEFPIGLTIEKVDGTCSAISQCLELNSNPYPVVGAACDDINANATSAMINYICAKDYYGSVYLTLQKFIAILHNSTKAFTIPPPAEFCRDAVKDAVNEFINKYAVAFSKNSMKLFNLSQGVRAALAQCSSTGAATLTTNSTDSTDSSNSTMPAGNSTIDIPWLVETAVEDGDYSSMATLVEVVTMPVVVDPYITSAAPMVTTVNSAAGGDISNAAPSPVVPVLESPLVIATNEMESETATESVVEIETGI